MARRVDEALVWHIAKKAVSDHHEHCCGRIDGLQQDVKKTDEALSYIRGQLATYKELGALKPGQKALVGGAAASGWIAVLGLVLQKALGLG